MGPGTIKRTKQSQQSHLEKTWQPLPACCPAFWIWAISTSSWLHSWGICTSSHFIHHHGYHLPSLLYSQPDGCLLAGLLLLPSSPWPSTDLCIQASPISSYSSQLKSWVLSLNSKTLGGLLPAVSGKSPAFCPFCIDFLVGPSILNTLPPREPHISSLYEV